MGRQKAGWEMTQTGFGFSSCVFTRPKSELFLKKTLIIKSAETDRLVSLGYRCRQTEMKTEQEFETLLFMNSLLVSYPSSFPLSICSVLSVDPAGAAEDRCFTCLL